ncbi:MAG: hypothetical protein HY762_01240 [Planctomycetes bacterium]|nr:hypothetical protein [Planctomycetota bacterium]
MRRKDYMPLRDDDFFTFQANLVSQVVANKVVWGIPDSAINPLVARRAEYEPFYHKAQDKTNRTRADILAHREMRQIYEKELSKFVLTADHGPPSPWVWSLRDTRCEIRDARCAYRTSRSAYPSGGNDTIQVVTGNRTDALGRSDCR